MDVWFQALTLLTIAITIAWILIRRRRRKLGAALLIAISVWAAVWLIGLGVAHTDWGTDHLSGWTECRSCDVWDGVGAWLIFGPPIAAAVGVIAAAVVAAIDRVQSARA